MIFLNPGVAAYRTQGNDAVITDRRALQNAGLGSDPHVSPDPDGPRRHIMRHSLACQRTRTFCKHAVLDQRISGHDPVPDLDALTAADRHSPERAIPSDAYLSTRFQGDDAYPVKYVRVYRTELADSHFSRPRHAEPFVHEKRKFDSDPRFCKPVINDGERPPQQRPKESCCPGRVLDEQLDEFRYAGH